MAAHAQRIGAAASAAPACAAVATGGCGTGAAAPPSTISALLHAQSSLLLPLESSSSSSRSPSMLCTPSGSPHRHLLTFGTPPQLQSPLSHGGGGSGGGAHHGLSGLVGGGGSMSLFGITPPLSPSSHLHLTHSALSGPGTPSSRSGSGLPGSGLGLSLEPGHPPLQLQLHVHTGSGMLISAPPSEGVSRAHSPSHPDHESLGLGADAHDLLQQHVAPGSGSVAMHVAPSTSGSSASGSGSGGASGLASLSAHGLGLSSGGSGSGPAGRSFSFSFNQPMMGSLLHNPNAMLLPLHSGGGSTPQSRSNSSTPHAMQLVGSPPLALQQHAHSHSLFALNSDSSPHARHAMPVDAQQMQPSTIKHELQGNISHGSCKIETDPQHAQAQADQQQSQLLASAAQMSSYSRHSSGGDSWARNSMDLDCSTAMFDAFPPLSAAGGHAGTAHAQMGRGFASPHMQMQAQSGGFSTSVFGSSTSAFPLASLSSSNGGHVQMHFSPRDGPPASQSSVSSLASRSLLHSPGFLTPTSGSRASAASGTPPSDDLSALLAQANSHKLEGNSLMLQRKLESLFLHQHQQQQQQQQQAHDQFYLLSPPHVHQPHFHEQAEASPPQLESPTESARVAATASAAAAVSSARRRATSEAVLRAAAVASAQLGGASSAHMESLRPLQLELGSPTMHAPSSSRTLSSSSRSGSSSTSSAASAASSRAVASAAAAAAAANKPPFVCQVCMKTFTQKGGLQNHLRIHNNERPFACEWDGCDKAFAQKCNLTRHKRCHTGEKPYKCAVCPRAFNRRWGLMVHSRSHGRDVPVMSKARAKAPKSASSSSAQATSSNAAAAASASSSSSPVALHLRTPATQPVYVPLSLPLLSSASGVRSFGGVANGGASGPLLVSPGTVSAPRLRAQLASLDAAASAFIRPTAAATAAEASRDSSGDRDRSGRTSGRRRAQAHGESDEAAALSPAAAVARDRYRPARSPPMVPVTLPLSLPLQPSLGSATASSSMRAHRSLRSSSQLPSQERTAIADFEMPPLMITDPRRRQEQQILLAAAAATSHTQ